MRCLIWKKFIQRQPKFSRHCLIRKDLGSLICFLAAELCACQILEAFHVTQPTLSHDMKLLVEAGIVKDRRDGKNIYYSLDEEVLGELQNRLSVMFQSKPECICHNHSGCGCNN